MDKQKLPRIAGGEVRVEQGGPARELDAALLALRIAAGGGAECTLSPAQAFALQGWLDVLETVARYGQHDVDDQVDEP